MLDGRLRENRIETFIRYFTWQLRTSDVDPAIEMMNYVFKRMEFNIEQKLWLCWLYANTYYLPTAYVIWNEFPDMENVDLERLTKWNTDNYKRLRYQTDNKWHKGHLPAMFESYRKAVGGSQVKMFELLCSSTDPRENYDTVWAFVNKNFHKFGRYISWFYIQSLAECVGLPIQPRSLLFGDSGSGSHRDGMCFVTGKDDWTSKYYENGKKVYREISYTDKVDYLQSKADYVMQEVKRRFPDIADKVTYFRMETALCSFKKLFRKRDGRYLGYYLDRQAEEIRRVEEDHWYGVDWELLWNHRIENLRPELYSREAKIRKSDMATFPETGLLPELRYFSDLI